MSATDVLLKPEECVILLVDFQAGLGFGVESMPRQIVVNNAVALARTAAAFKIPINLCNARLQRSFASRVARSSSVCESYRTQKHECLGR
jgi:nicotinamidase-related amidase